MQIERDYPPERRAGDWRGYVLWVIDGCETRIDLYTPPHRVRRSRCDSYEARMGELVIVERGGLRVIDDVALSRYIPRPMPRSAF